MFLFKNDKYLNFKVIYAIFEEPLGSVGGLGLFIK
jgi:hypothetical protein